ncbi:MAG: tetratricopeptide repeat protein [Cyclobacteriaceae bacterium]|nr:tetratricopeptide repeat protein [Cyclobacteriaceae bacterium]
MKKYYTLLLFLLLCGWADAQSQPPAEAEKLFNEGLDYKSRQQYAEAVDKFTQAIAVFPWSFDYWHQRGYVRIDMGQYHEAIADFSYMLYFSPKHLRARMERAFALKQIGNAREALEEYRVAVQDHPADFQAHYEYGYSLIDFEEYTKGIEHMKKASELNPESGDPLYELAFCYLKTKQYQTALDTFKSAQAKLGDRTPPGYYFHIAECQVKLGKKAEACTNFEKAEQLKVQGAAEARVANCK